MLASSYDPEVVGIEAFLRIELDGGQHGSECSLGVILCKRYFRGTQICQRVVRLSLERGAHDLVGSRRILEEQELRLRQCRLAARGIEPLSLAIKKQGVAIAALVAKERARSESWPRRSTAAAAARCGTRAGPPCAFRPARTARPAPDGSRLSARPNGRTASRSRAPAQQRLRGGRSIEFSRWRPSHWLSSLAISWRAASASGNVPEPSASCSVARARLRSPLRASASPRW